MVNVSTRNLRKDVLKKIQAQFDTTILKSKNSKTGLNYLNELLTESEKLLLSKRLAIVLMLEKRILWKHIQHTLDVSHSTVARVQKNMNQNKYPTIVSILHSKQKQDEFWKVIEVLLRAGMPAYGKGRWDMLNALNKRDNRVRRASKPK